jgi:hypothetical protein
MGTFEKKQSRSRQRRKLIVRQLRSLFQWQGPTLPPPRMA